MAQFYKFFMQFMLVALMTVSIFSFVITVQENNNSPEKIINDSIINQTYQDLKTETLSFREQGQNQMNLFREENPISSFGSLIFYSIISVGKVLDNMVINIFNLLINLPVKFLGIDPAIVSIISIMIISTILIGLWIIYKVGG